MTKKILIRIFCNIKSCNLKTRSIQTEEVIIDKVNELGQRTTEEALKNLEIKESVISVKEQKLYAKNVKQISNTIRRNRAKKKSICSTRKSETGLSN